MSTDYLNRERIGIMQGRLSPPIEGRIQSFPWNTWDAEFEAASNIGFSGIDWIFEGSNWQKNPIIVPSDRKLIQKYCLEWNVKIFAICADYFMDYPLVRWSMSDTNMQLSIIQKLIESCEILNIPFIEIPCVDNSAITTEEENEQLVEAIIAMLPFIEQSNVVLALETNLGPEQFKSLLSKIDHPQIRANYDTGNSASLGYNSSAELASYGTSIVTVHIKDRIRNGGTVPLGDGYANLPLTFSILSKLSYDGPFILQVARGKDEIEWGKLNFELVSSLIDNHFNESPASIS